MTVDALRFSMSVIRHTQFCPINGAKAKPEYPAKGPSTKPFCSFGPELTDSNIKGSVLFDLEKEIGRAHV